MIHAKEGGVRIGVVGTGFIATRFLWTIECHDGYETSRVLTRREIAKMAGYDYAHLLTNSTEELLASSDLIVECSGDPVHATNVVDAALRAGLPVVTMDSEFQATTGSYFTGRGLLTEAEGDQPGAIAALVEDAREQGFTPLVLGNMKGFLNLDPTPEEMEFWARKQNFTVALTTAATDGTKISFEQALAANGLGATILQTGMLGPQLDDLGEAAHLLAERAIEQQQMIADYVLSATSTHGVFVVAKHEARHADALETYKMGTGPYYTLIRRDISGYLEIMKTVKRVAHGRGALLDNGTHPTVGVAAVAKRPLPAGTLIGNGIGSFDLRGTTIRIADHPGHAPLGLVQDAVVRRDVAAGEVVPLDAFELPESLALHAWKTIEDRSLGLGVASNESTYPLARPHID